MKMFRVALIAAGFLVFDLVTCAPALSATPTQAQIDNAWAHGMAWLFSNQSGDGFWKSKEGTEIASTALAIEALNNAPLKAYPFHKGVSWLANAKANSTDSLARQATALKVAGINATPYLDKLKAMRNSNSSWGAYSQFDTSYPDTPLALSAIRIGQVAYDVTERNNALCELYRGQSTSSSGKWSYMRRDVALVPGNMATDSVTPTALALFELKSLGLSVSCAAGNSTITYANVAVVDNGKNWLVSKMNAGDGGIGDNGSSVVESAMALKALAAISPTTAPLLDPVQGPLIDYLLRQQNTSNGSWGGDAFRTALVLSVLPKPSTLSLNDTDGDGIPDLVENKMGKNPLVKDMASLAPGGGNTHAGLVLGYALVARAFQNRPVTIGLPITSGQAPFSWSVVSGVMPPGLIFNAGGYISGTPTALGTYTFTYAVTETTTGASGSAIGEIKIVPYGDWNGDGVVDSKDTAIIVNIINSILLDD
jgi:hypothetical protein